MYQGSREPPAFFAPFAESLHPCVSVRPNGMMCPNDILRVNLGRHPFAFPPPDDFLPLENPANPSSSWMTRFEHGVSVVEVIHSRATALPTSVIDMAFATETASAEAKQLSLSFFSKSPGVQMRASPFQDPGTQAGVATTRVRSCQQTHTFTSTIVM